MRRLPLPRSPRTVLVLAALVAPSLGGAQIVGGRAIERTTRLPMRLLDVLLLADTTVIARTQTDTNGVFYLDAGKGGLFKVRFQLPTVAEFTSDTFRVADTEFLQRDFIVALPFEPIFLEFEVEKQVAPMPGNQAPRYPTDLREKGVTGEVVTQFVVDTLGRARMSTFKVLSSSDPGFARAVTDAIPSFRFYPAEINHHKVAQLVRMPFQFHLSRW